MSWSFSCPGNLAFLILYSHWIPELLSQLLIPNSLKWEIVTTRENYPCAVRAAPPSSSAAVLALPSGCRKALPEKWCWEMSSEPGARGWARAGILQLCLAGWIPGHSTWKTIFLAVSGHGVRCETVSDWPQKHLGWKTSKTEPSQTLPCHTLSRGKTSSAHSGRAEQWVKLSHQMFWYNKGIPGNWDLLSAGQNCSRGWCWSPAERASLEGK